ncbi:MAG: hypothetical protein ACRC7S_16930 [Cetobacterium sp.]
MNVKEIREKLIKFDDYTDVLTTCRHCGNGYSGNIAFEVNDFTNQTFGYIQIEMNSGVEQPLMFERKVSVDKKDLYTLKVLLNGIDVEDFLFDEKQSILEKISSCITPEEENVFKIEKELTSLNKEFMQIESELKNTAQETIKFKGLSLKHKITKTKIKIAEDKLDETYGVLCRIEHERKYNK